MAKNFKFPSTLYSEVAAGQHYMLIDSYESRNAISSGNIISSIALYIPPNSLQTTYGANYEGMNSGALAGAAGEKARQAFETGGGSGGIMKSMIAGLKTDTARAGAISGIVSKMGGNSTLGQLALGAGAGLAVNNHMALVYRGPNTFRSHSFNFSFFPKDRGEADTVKEIIEDFRNGMLPRYSGAGSNAQNGRLSSPFFKMPRHYRLMFMCPTGENKFIDIFPKNNQGDQINHVITGMTVNHDQNSVISLHKDGSPVQSTLSITFQETEFPTSRDAGDDRFNASINTDLTNESQAQSLVKRAQRDKESAQGAYNDRMKGEG